MIRATNRAGWAHKHKASANYSVFSDFQLLITLTFIISKPLNNALRHKNIGKV